MDAFLAVAEKHGFWLALMVMFAMQVGPALRDHLLPLISSSHRRRLDAEAAEAQRERDEAAAKERQREAAENRLFDALDRSTTAFVENTAATRHISKLVEAFTGETQRQGRETAEMFGYLKSNLPPRGRGKQDPVGGGD